MAKSSPEYWEKRIAAGTWNVYNSLEERNRELHEFYIDASKEVKNELYALAEKYSKDGVLTLSEMHKQNRLTELNRKYEQIAFELGKKTESAATQNMNKGFREVYKNTAVGMGVEDFSMPNRKLMNKLLNEPWRGDSFSNRLWKNQRKLAVGLNDILLTGLQQGKTVTEIAVNLHNFMGQGFNNCHRLVRTETMHYLNSATLQRYKDAGVKYVQIWAAQDERTCSTCGSYHGKVYPIDKCPILPFHANCRCTILPCFDEKLIAAASESSYKNFKEVYYNDKNSYDVKLDGFNSNVNSGVSEACRNVAKLGSKDRCEHMHLVNLSSGELNFYETNNSPNEVGMDFWNYIDKHPDDKFAFIHNHNTDTSFSEADLRTLLTTENIPVMIAARNDGVIYLVERKGGRIKSGWFDDLYEDELKVLNEQSRQGIISGEERSLRREIMIVENLIRDYTKGLVQIDGRK